MALFRRILVPHDFSAHADHALRVAADLARAERGRLVVLHVIPPLEVVGVPGEMVWIPPTLPIGSQRRHLERVVARARRGRGAAPAACRVVVGDPFARILEAARDADVIVMSTAGRTGLSHLLIGSVAEKVVRHSPVPVLTIRPGTARAARGRTTRRRGTMLRAARRR